MKRVSIITLLSFSMALTAILQSCGSSKEHEEAEAKKKSPAEVPPIETIALQQGQLSSSLHMPGELIAFQQVDIYAKVSSFVKKLYADVGTEVKAGQLIATMEAPEVNSQLSGAQSRLKSQEAVYLSSKATYDRLLATSQTPGTVSQNDLDIASAKQKSDYAQLESTRAALREVSDTRNYLEIRAPFDGVISARNVSAGAYVGPSGKGSEMPIFTLQEERKLRLAVSVPAAYTSYLKQNAAVKFTTKSLPNQVFDAKVSRLAGALDTRLRSQRTEMDVDNSNKKLLPGMVAEVMIPLDGMPATFIVPSKAVLNSTTGVFIIKVTNNKTVWVPVKTGRSEDNKTEIYGELTPGDTIVKNATEEIRDGATASKIVVAKTDQ